MKSRARLKNKGKKRKTRQKYKDGGQYWGTQRWLEEETQARYHSDDVFLTHDGTVDERRNQQEVENKKGIQNFRQDPNKPAAHQHIAFHFRGGDQD